MNRPQNPILNPPSGHGLKLVGKLFKTKSCGRLEMVWMFLVGKKNGCPRHTIVDLANTPPDVSELLQAKVNDSILEGQWSIPPYFESNYMGISRSVKEIILPLDPQKDIIVWRHFIS